MGYYLGLDVGTNSVGYAVTDEQYHLRKFHGEPIWGSHVFEEAKPSAERRGFRTARRRLNRRQQRVQLVQEIFAREIAKVDPRFFIRLQESRLHREDVEAGDKTLLFNDVAFTDKEYYAKYPTIHHLLFDLMNSDEAHDVRLVYLATAWLVAHRGHFLSEVDKENIEQSSALTKCTRTSKTCWDCMESSPGRATRKNCKLCCCSGNGSRTSRKTWRISSTQGRSSKLAKAMRSIKS